MTLPVPGWECSGGDHQGPEPEPPPGTCPCCSSSWSSSTQTDTTALPGPAGRLRGSNEAFSPPHPSALLNNHLWLTPQRVICHETPPGLPWHVGSSAPLSLLRLLPPGHREMQDSPEDLGSQGYPRHRYSPPSAQALNDSGSTPGCSQRNLQTEGRNHQATLKVPARILLHLPAPSRQILALPTLPPQRHRAAGGPSSSQSPRRGAAAQPRAVAEWQQRGWAPLPGTLPSALQGHKNPSASPALRHRGQGKH